MHGCTFGKNMEKIIELFTVECIIIIPTFQKYFYTCQLHFVDGNIMLFLSTITMLMCFRFCCVFMLLGSTSYKIYVLILYGLNVDGIRYYVITILQQSS